MITKTYEELMSEINLTTIEEALKNAEKCLEAFEVRDIIRQQQETINCLQAEIERLQTAKSFECNVTKFFDRYKTHIKAEAVKEFAERLKEELEGEYIKATNKLENAQNIVVSTNIKIVDNLVKEMVGEG